MKRRKSTTWSDCIPDSNKVETQEWTVTRSISRPNGRTCVRTSCPFCTQSLLIYVWSLRGGGKRCENRDCGAMLGSGGTAYRLIAEAV